MRTQQRLLKTQKLKADPLAMLELLRQGLPLRKIGSAHHITESGVRYHLRKLSVYNRLLGNAIRRRYKAACDAMRITPTRDNRRKQKLARAILERERPISAARLDEKTRPKACSSCGSADLETRKVSDLWRWSCRKCGAAKTESVVKKRMLHR